MTSVVQEFDAREGGAFRVSLTYDELDRTGKSAARTDTYHGRFPRLVPNERLVEVLEFETADPALQGQMTITTTLTDELAALVESQQPAAVAMLFLVVGLPGSRPAGPAVVHGGPSSPD